MNTNPESTTKIKCLFSGDENDSISIPIIGSGFSRSKAII